MRPWKLDSRATISLRPAVALGEAHGAFVGLGAGVAEEGLLQLARGDLGELLGQGADGGHVVDVAAGVDDLVGLRLGGLDDGWLWWPALVTEMPAKQSTYSLPSAS